MSAKGSRAVSATLVAVIVTAILWGVLAFATASAQDTPVTPPTANGGMMTGYTNHALHGSVMVTDTVRIGRGPHQGASGEFMNNRGAASGRHQALAAPMHAAHMAGAMGGQHMQSGAMAGAWSHGEGQAFAGHSPDGAPCTNCH